MPEEVMPDELLSFSRVAAWVADHFNGFVPTRMTYWWWRNLGLLINGQRVQLQAVLVGRRYQTSVAMLVSFFDACGREVTETENPATPWVGSDRNEKPRNAVGGK